MKNTRTMLIFLRGIRWWTQMRQNEWRKLRHQLNASWAPYFLFINDNWNRLHEIPERTNPTSIMYFVCRKTFITCVLSYQGQNVMLEVESYFRFLFWYCSRVRSNRIFIIHEFNCRKYYRIGYRLNFFRGPWFW